MGEAENPILGLARRARAEGEKALGSITDQAQLAAWFTEYLGRGGRLTAMARTIGELDADLRRDVGAAVNRAKQALEEAYELRRQAIDTAARESLLAAEAIDVTLPGTTVAQGGLHPSTRILRRVCEIFGDMGFQVYQSCDVETDHANFELLNIPPDHPARDMQDTFYVDSDVLLRTHTSPGQIHAMREFAPEPIRIVLPGMCYRHEQITARSEIQFHQVEGLAVDRSITMADLKGTIQNFARRMFGTDRDVRFRASYFPFTEPSAEVDVRCFLCDGNGCRLCKQTGWLEIMGCGMVHPVVLANGGYDPEVYSGFAFGGGIERTAMLRQGIDDIRHFWANDMRFLSQSGRALEIGR
jgi:phenylalanyl-tRNA synthetase alpha chain